MPIRNSQPVSFFPTGLCDALDQQSAFPGACQSLANVIFDRSTRGAIVSRPGVTVATNFPGFTTPGVVSAQLTVGTKIYGMIATARNIGFDEPFVYDTVANSFATVSGVLASNVPTTQATTGAWTPPTMDVIGTKVVVTHPGFSGGNFIGFFDISGFTLATTATTTVTSATLTVVASTTGVLNGMSITGTGIPANTVVLSTTASTIVMSNAATASAAGVAITIAGGSAASPAWGAGNTATNALTSKPIWVVQFFNRAYYGVTNAVFFSDSLSALSISNTNFAGVLTLGDPTSSVGASGLAFSTSSAGILSSLIVFKSNSIYQVSGDITGTGSGALALNTVSANIGTNSPRTLQSSPEGIYFIASDGPRLIDLRGQLQNLKRDEQVNPDIVAPFTNGTTLSRACASYNNSIYRVCLDTVIAGTAMPAADFWYDALFSRWNGIHSFGYHSASGVGQSFYLASNAAPGKLFKSDVTPNASSVYLDNALAYTSTMQSDLLIEPSAMNEMAIVESTIEISKKAPSGSYAVTATDDLGNILNSVTVQYSGGSLWGGGTWGGLLWSFGGTANHPATIPWSVPLVFKKLYITVASTASTNYSLREIKLRLMKLGYMNQ